jgi:C4-dicarboxylate-specific signal transduction histidine kinase
VRLETPPAAARVHGNKGQLLQVMVNLITNAVFAMRDVATRTRVCASAPSCRVRGRCRSGGRLRGGYQPGHARIFDPLFTTKGPNELGLTIYRSIIRTRGRSRSCAAAPGDRVCGVLQPVHRAA